MAAEIIELSVASSTADAVYKMCAEDYPPAAMAWIKSKHVRWEPAHKVALSEIDFGNKKNWKAYSHDSRIKMFVKEMKNGYDKPVLLIRVPGKRGLVVIDGHHRALAAHRLNRPVNGYIGNVDSARGPWAVMHDMQNQSMANKVQKRVQQKYLANDVDDAIELANRTQLEPADRLQAIAAILAARLPAEAATADIMQIWPAAESAALLTAVQLANTMAVTESPAGPGTSAAVDETNLRLAVYLTGAYRRISTGMGAAFSRLEDKDEAAAAVLAAEVLELANEVQAAGRRWQAGKLLDSAREVYGDLLGWYASTHSPCSPSCAAADGHNFWADRQPLTGYPGISSTNCRCVPGMPFSEGPVLLSQGMQFREFEFANGEVQGPGSEPQFNTALHPHGYGGKFATTTGGVTPEAGWISPAAWEAGQDEWGAKGKAAWLANEWGKLHAAVPNAKAGIHVITTPRGTEFHKVKDADGVFHWVGRAANGDTFKTETRKQLHMAAHEHETGHKTPLTGLGETKHNVSYAVPENSALSGVPEPIHKVGDHVVAPSGKHGKVSGVVAQTSKPGWQVQVDHTDGTKSSGSEFAYKSAPGEVPKPEPEASSQFNADDKVIMSHSGEKGTIVTLGSKPGWGPTAVLKLPDGSTQEVPQSDLEFDTTATSDKKPAQFKTGDNVTTPNSGVGKIVATGVLSSGDQFAHVKMADGPNEAYTFDELKPAKLPDNMSVSGAKDHFIVGDKVKDKTLGYQGTVIVGNATKDGTVTFLDDATGQKHTAKTSELDLVAAKGQKENGTGKQPPPAEYAAAHTKASIYGHPQYIKQNSDGSGNYVVSGVTPTISAHNEHWVVQPDGKWKHVPGDIVSPKETKAAPSLMPSKYPMPKGGEPELLSQYNKGLITEDEYVEAAGHLPQPESSLPEKPTKTAEQLAGTYWQHHYELKPQDMSGMTQWLQDKYKSVDHVYTKMGVNKGKKIATLRVTHDGMVNLDGGKPGSATYSGKSINEAMDKFLKAYKPAYHAKVHAGDSAPGVPGAASKTYQEMQSKSTPAPSVNPVISGSDVSKTDAWKKMIQGIEQNGIQEQQWLASDGKGNFVLQTQNPKFAGSPNHGHESFWLDGQGNVFHWTPGTPIGGTPVDHSLTKVAKQAKKAWDDAHPSAAALKKAAADAKFAELTNTLPAQSHDDYLKTQTHYKANAVPKLTSTEISAIHAYQGSGYTSINSPLHKIHDGTFDKSKLSASILDRIKKIDSAMSKWSLPFDVTVRRGISNANWLPTESIVGKEITEHAFSSTSFDKGFSSHHVNMWIRVPKGMPAIHMNGISGSVHPGESELLLPRGVRFIVIKDEVVNGTRVLILQAVIPNPGDIYQLSNIFKDDAGNPWGQGNIPDTAEGKRFYFDAKRLEFRNPSAADTATILKALGQM